MKLKIGIFDSGIGEFNENVAYINLSTLEDFFNKDTESLLITNLSNMTEVSSQFSSFKINDPQMVILFKTK